jgi:SAM-dependent methyltransferase
MKTLSVTLVAVLGLAGLGLEVSSLSRAQAPAPRTPDVPYEPTPPKVMAEMLRLARIRPADVVYDLGCGDGRIVIAAIKDSGARGVCVDIDPQRIAESRRNAEGAGVADRISFRTEDLFTTRIEDATVVMLFLWPEINLRLRPRLLRELRPGTRIISHWHDMGDWKPEKSVNVLASGRERPVYYWTVPAHSEPPGSF